MQQVLEMGARLVAEKLGVDVGTVTAALQGLLGNAEGGVDLAGLAAKLSSSADLGSIMQTWLGDGANAPISPQSILGLFGEDSVAKFADRVGTDTGTAADTLSDVLPQMMDKASSGGNLLDAAGGMDGLLGAAKSFFR